MNPPLTPPHSSALCIFLVNIEVSIVGTSLVSITQSLGHFRKSGWVVTAYLITYTGMLIIWAKMSDLWGRRSVTLSTIAIFTLFSAGCGAARTMDELIICRAFQGIGAAGCVSMGLCIAYEAVPKKEYPGIAAKIAAATALGSLVGPLIGGGVSERSTWRWVFLMNVPAGVLTMVLLIIGVPSDFPHQKKRGYRKMTFREMVSGRTFARLDLVGSVLLLGATLLLVTVLLEANNEFEWNSAVAIALLVVSGVMWVAFFVNERIVTGDSWRTEPVFPWRFLFNREWMGVLM